MHFSLLAVAVALLVSAVGSASGSSTAGCRRPEMHAKHEVARGHRYLCRMRVVGSRVVSETAGLGNIEFKGALGAVLQRDEGIVALLDMSNPTMPKTVGRYDDGATDSFDGDLAFSKDGSFLFYARQTHQFSKDGVHVLDVS